jgi:hypothetical protein
VKTGSVIAADWALPATSVIAAGPDAAADAAAAAAALVDPLGRPAFFTSSAPGVVR